MKEKLKYNFFHIIPLHYSEFYTVIVFYYVALKIVAFFVISSDKTEMPESSFVKREEIFLKKKAQMLFLSYLAFF